MPCDLRSTPLRTADDEHVHVHPAARGRSSTVKGSVGLAPAFSCELVISRRPRSSASAVGNSSPLSDSVDSATAERQSAPSLRRTISLAAKNVPEGNAYIIETMTTGSPYAVPLPKNASTAPGISALTLSE
jgi:hypothetical protein